MKNFYFFGDSITMGQYVSLQDTWVDLSVEEFTSKNRDVYAFQNCSIGGDTTLQALLRIHNDILFRNPAGIYIQFGLNDCNIWEDQLGVPRVTIEAFKAHLKEMILRAKAFNCWFLVFGTNHLTNKNTGYDEKNKEYNNVIREVSEQCILIDHEKNWEDKVGKCYSDYLLEDGVHLNKKGHQLYAHLISKELMQWL